MAGTERRPVGRSRLIFQPVIRIHGDPGAAALAVRRSGEHCDTLDLNGIPDGIPGIRYLKNPHGPSLCRKGVIFVPAICTASTPTEYEHLEEPHFRHTAHLGQAEPSSAGSRCATTVFAAVVRRISSRRAIISSRRAASCLVPASSASSFSASRPMKKVASVAVT